MDKNKLVELLESKLEEVDELSKSYEPNKIKQWKNEVLMILDGLVSENSKYYKQIEKLLFHSMVLVMGEDNTDSHFESYQRDINSAKSIINSIIFGVKNNLLS